MKFSSKKSLLIGSVLVATVILTGCPTSREGSGTSTGHGPAKVQSDTTKSGIRTTEKTSTDTSGTGTGHRPK